MVFQFNGSRIALEHTSIHENFKIPISLAAISTDAVPGKQDSPNIEELAEIKSARSRRFNMYYACLVVSVNRGSEPCCIVYANVRRHRHLLASDEDIQMLMDM